MVWQVRFSEVFPDIGRQEGPAVHAEAAAQLGYLLQVEVSRQPVPPPPPVASLHHRSVLFYDPGVKFVDGPMHPLGHRSAVAEPLNDADSPNPGQAGLLDTADHATFAALAAPVWAAHEAAARQADLEPL